jgi:hypothetical protein
MKRKLVWLFVVLVMAVVLRRLGMDAVGHFKGEEHYGISRSLRTVDWTDVILEYGEERGEIFVHHGPPPQRADNDKLWSKSNSSQYTLRAACDGKERIQRRIFRVTFDGNLWYDVYCLLPPQSA